MVRSLTARSTVPLLVGVVLGIGIALVFAARPVGATATDHSDEFSIATGMINQSLEAVYLLDFTSGRLLGTVLNNQTGKFQQFSERNLAEDFALNPRQKPKFVMVTGLMQVARAQVSTNHVLYVAEVKSGRMAAYYIPLLGAGAQGTITKPIEPVDMIPFRQGGVRPQ